MRLNWWVQFPVSEISCTLRQIPGASHPYTASILKAPPPCNSCLPASGIRAVRAGALFCQGDKFTLIVFGLGSNLSSNYRSTHVHYNLVKICCSHSDLLSYSFSTQPLLQPATVMIQQIHALTILALSTLLSINVQWTLTLRLASPVESVFCSACLVSEIMAVSYCSMYI